ncbi:MAG TPA: response regulator [Calditrichia bacterium]|nr:response regulator [Calditrichota bacterium]HQV30637.1 response regulator [Calditrichia bacterium]
MSQRILIVDDNESLLSGMETMIEMVFDDVEINLANSGAQAAQHLRSGKPDLVFLDMNLPDVKGTQILEVIQKNWPGLPVFILSGESDLANIPGAAGVLLKPVMPKTLTALIEKHIAV